MIFSPEISKTFLIFILLTAALIITIKDLVVLINVYTAQSFIIVLLSLLMYSSTGNSSLLIIAAIIFVGKVIIIPIIIKNVQKRLRIRRDVEFHHLTPISSIFVSSIVALFSYTTFSRLFSEFPNKSFLLTASLAVSLVFMGLIIIFTRKQTITNVIGFLTMENGVVLFSLFVAELPLIIEVLILLDLIVLVALITIFAFGIDTNMEDFHNKLNPLTDFFGDEK